MPTLEKQLEASVSQSTGSWTTWQFFLLFLYPLAVLQILVFWIRYAKADHLKDE